MATSLKDVKKNNDAFHKRSSSSLKREIKRQIKRVFVSDLELMEIKFGRDFEGYEELRAKILRNGNDAIRYIEELLDRSYNVQKVPDLTFVDRNPLQEVTTDQLDEEGQED